MVIAPARHVPTTTIASDETHHGVPKLVHADDAVTHVTQSDHQLGVFGQFLRRKDQGVRPLAALLYPNSGTHAKGEVTLVDAGVSYVIAGEQAFIHAQPYSRLQPRGHVHLRPKAAACYHETIAPNPTAVPAKNVRCTRDVLICASCVASVAWQEWLPRKQLALRVCATVRRIPALKSNSPGRPRSARRP